MRQDPQLLDTIAHEGGGEGAAEEVAQGGGEEEGGGKIGGVELVFCSNPEAMRKVRSVRVRGVRVRGIRVWGAP